MTEAARLDVVIGADIDRALRGFDQVQTRMSTFSQTALGMFAGGMLQRGLDAFAGTVTTGFDRAFTAVSDYEQRTMAMENLVAREMKRNSEVTEVIGQRKRGLSKEEQEEYDNLIGKLDEYNFKQQGVMLDVERARERLNKADNPLEESEAQYSLQGLERDYNNLQAQIAAATARQADLNAMREQSIDITQTRQTMQQAEALSLAEGKAKELLAWTEQLAIASPFDQKGVQTAYQMALNYSFQSEKAQRLTQDTIDWAAGMGKSNQEINQVTRALGQMNTKGKVMGQELLQLTEAGFGANDVLKMMGVTLDDVSRGTVSSEKFIEMAMQMMEQDFGGAAARSQETWQGLMNSLGDITDIGLRKFSEPIMTEVKPIFSNVVAELNTPEVFAQVEAWGQEVGERVGLALGWIQEKYTMGRGWLLGLLGLEDRTVSPAMRSKDPGFVDDYVGFGEMWAAIQDWFNSHDLAVETTHWVEIGANALTEWVGTNEEQFITTGVTIGSAVGGGIRSVFTGDIEIESTGQAIADFLIRASEVGFKTAGQTLQAFEEALVGHAVGPEVSLGGYFSFVGKQYEDMSKDMRPMQPIPGTEKPITMPGWVQDWWETSGMKDSWDYGMHPLSEWVGGQWIGQGAAPGGTPTMTTVNFTYINQGVQTETIEEVKRAIGPAFTELYRQERAGEAR